MPNFSLINNPTLKYDPKKMTSNKILIMLMRLQSHEMIFMMICFSQIG